MPWLRSHLSSRSSSSSGTIFDALQTHLTVIYGDDRRQDVDDADATIPQAVRPNAAATVLMIHRDALDRLPDGSYHLATRRYGTTRNFCDGEAFVEQPRAITRKPSDPGVCTGILIAPSVVLTASHCAEKYANIHDSRFVFGFKKHGTRYQTYFSSAEISTGVAVIASGRSSGHDWILVEISGSHSTNVRIGQQTLRNGQSVYALGYPNGLPLKYAPEAAVRDALSDYFTANLDTYGGNSGSPVFSTSTGELCGLFVRGEIDFVPVGSCIRSNRCPDTGCAGQECLYLRDVNDALTSRQQKGTG